MNHNKLSISGKIWLCVLTLSIVCISLLGYAIFEMKKLESTMIDISDVQLPVVRNMTLIDMMHDGTKALVMGAFYVNSHENTAANREIIEADIKDISENFNLYFKNIKQLPTSTKIKDSIKNVEPDINSYIMTANNIIALIHSNQIDAAINHVDKFQSIFDVLEEKLGSLGDLIESEAKSVSINAKSTAKTAFIFMSLLIAISLIFVLILSYYVIRSLTKKLQANASNLSTCAEKVGEFARYTNIASNDLKDSSHKQASTAQETSSSLYEINAMVSKTEDHTRSLRTVVEASRKLSAEGGEAVASVVDSMEDIKKSNQQILEVVQESNDGMSKIVDLITDIGNKTNVINDIVFQTKLLSFNASVEAARAGEHGKGFAVVAEEVGNLARLSGESAEEISKMLNFAKSEVDDIIKSGQQKIASSVESNKSILNKGAEKVDLCGTVINNIVEQVSQVDYMTKEISDAISEQTLGIKNITNAINIFDTASKENADLSANVSQTSVSLISEFNELKSIVEELKILLNGNKNTTSSDDSHKLNTDDETEEENYEAQNESIAA